MLNRAQRIDHLLRELDPIEIEVINESARHAGHQADDGSGETHYKICLCCSAFLGLSRIERHRLVHQKLEQEFMTGLHALVLQLSTPEEKIAAKCKKGLQENTEYI